MQDDGKGQIFTGRRMQHERRGRCPLTPTSFSCLDTGKRMRKENQGIRDAGQISLPRKGSSGMPANLTGSPTLSLLDLRFLSRTVTLRADGCRDCHCRRHLLSVSWAARRRPCHCHRLVWRHRRPFRHLHLLASSVRLAFSDLNPLGGGCRACRRPSLAF